MVKDDLELLIAIASAETAGMYHRTQLFILLKVILGFTWRAPFPQLTLETSPAKVAAVKRCREGVFLGRNTEVPSS